MSDFGFGFSPEDSDPDRKRGPEGQGNPFGFGAGGPGQGAGFDANALGQMLQQFGQMLTNMGQAAKTGSGSNSPINYDLAKQLAHQFVGSTPSISAGASSAAADSVHLAELWLDEATTFPAGATRTVAWSPREWIDGTIDTWKRLCDPVAAQINGMWTQNIPAEAQQFAGPVLGIIGQMGGMAFGSQLGQALAQLSKEILTSTDIGLPLGPNGVAAVLPGAISQFAKDIEQPEREVFVFIAAREAAHQRLFHHVPWLRQRVLATVEEFARGIKVDTSAIEELASGIDPMTMFSDPSKLEEILSKGAFEPQTTPEQKATLERLETLLALIEGWVDTVVKQALGERLPGVGAMSETLRRRRAAGGPAEQTFATLVGLELRPRKLREAAALWQQLTDQRGIEVRDAVWEHPDLMPDARDLDDPSAFIAHTGVSSSDFDEALRKLNEEEPGEEPK
ncbi:MAG: zinc-dependent metalloprotease [Nocardiaceae bacterium]|nr:zinc-dependent metalloprotease [Nocardiaceae bacterium]